jgi:hypothetical protein
VIEIPSEADRILQSAAARAARRMQGPEVPLPKKARNHGKRHSTNRERSYEARQKAADSARKIAENIARDRLVRDTVAAYYRGEVPDLSSIAHLLRKQV